MGEAAAASAAKVDPDDSDSKSNCSSGSEREGRGICEEFWTFVRSILEKATPVGFEELDDPESVAPKGKADADNFLTKCVSIGMINPIHPAVLARESGVPHQVVMEELLYATKVGLASMRWAPECERCGSAVTEAAQIGRLPARADCKGCHYPNVIDTMDRIKVLFNLTQDVLYVLMENYACQPSSASMGENALFAAVPATSTGSGFRYSVGCGRDELRPAFDPGKYRMHCPVSKTDNYLTVQESASPDDRPIKLKMRISDIVCDGSPGSAQKELIVPHGKVHFDIIPDTHSFFVLWVQNDVDDDTLLRLPPEERAPYTSATEMIHHDAFQRLFADQVVSSRPEALLKIKRVVLVFTDVVGSTNLYASLGDGPALQLVRKHYAVLFSAFTRRGRVVKTIGDAVMASFSSGRHAVEACAEALRKVPRECVLPDGRPLEIRIGVHCGSAVVVPLNGVNDYFGQTVNIAARVEAAVKASECFVTDAVLGLDPDARSAYYEILAGRNASSCRRPGTFESTPETELNLKGVSEPVLARGFRLRTRALDDPGSLSDLDSDHASSDGGAASASGSGTGWKVGEGGKGNETTTKPPGVKGVSTRPAARAKRRSSVTKVDEAEEKKVDEAEETEIKEMLDRMPSALSSEGDN
uniref:Guanylate cyclase domain-containing protein n=1 Tax=Odontella aurita TaxID=265563 RepID=A0A7S4KD36_9STRA